MSMVMDCPVCDGEGQIEVNGKWELCPECNGSGVVKQIVKKPKHFPTYKDGGRK